MNWELFKSAGKGLAGELARPFFAELLRSGSKVPEPTVFTCPAVECICAAPLSTLEGDKLFCWLVAVVLVLSLSLACFSGYWCGRVHADYLKPVVAGESGLELRQVSGVRFSEVPVFKHRQPRTPRSQSPLVGVHWQPKGKLSHAALSAAREAARSLR